MDSDVNDNKVQLETKYLGTSPTFKHDQLRKTGWCTKGSTDKKREGLADVTIAVNNQIMVRYLKLKYQTGKKKKLPNGLLWVDIENTLNNYCSPSNFTISSSTTCKRIERGGTFATHKAGLISPFQAFQTFIVVIIIQMTRIHQLLNLRKYIVLVNYLIEENIDRKPWLRRRLVSQKCATNTWWYVLERLYEK